VENKEHQRYILFKIIADGEIQKQRLIQIIWRHLFQLYGETGTGQTGLWLAEFDKNQKYGILRTNVETLPMVRSTLAVIRRIDEVNCIFASIATSGTINALKKKHLNKITRGTDEDKPTTLNGQ